jgi:hypothetical protein
MPDNGFSHQNVELHGEDPGLGITHTLTQLVFSRSGGQQLGLAFPESNY